MRKFKQSLYVSVGSITSWKQADNEYGIRGLRLNYQGRQSYLSDEHLPEDLSWLLSLLS